MGIERHRSEILRRAAGDTPPRPLPDGIGIVELDAGDLPRILADTCAHGEARSMERLAIRFEHGLRHFVLEHEGRSIAWSWLAAGVPRYIDELCWSVPMTTNQAWVRDAFVVPAQRLGGSIEFFSDVDAVNRSSLRAHAAAGFVPCASVVAIQASSLCLRPRPPATLPTVHALRPSRRMLWLNREERQWHLRHIA